MKWHIAVDTPSGRGLRVDFSSGESLIIAKGIDDRLHIVSTTTEGVMFAVESSGALAVAPKVAEVTVAERRKARNGHS